MRRPCVLALVLAALVAAGCGGTSTREQVDAYVKRLNAVQQDAAPAFAEANRAYGRVVRKRLRDDAVVPKLIAADLAIRRTRARIARIDAPPSARRLRARMLRVFGLNAGLARETVLLARYVPVRGEILDRVARANGRMASALEEAAEPDAQAATFAAYQATLGRAIEELDQLAPPPVSAAAHRQQLRRLRASHRLAGDLRRAVLARDPARTARLVIAFQRVGLVRAGERALQRRELEAYSERRREISRAVAEARRERARLDRMSK